MSLLIRTRKNNTAANQVIREFAILSDEPTATKNQFMLPAANRLRHYKDFKSVYAQGIHRKTAHLSLRAINYSEQVTSKPSRIGISISQKVSKKAVIRNRIKRQIRSALRQMLPQLLPGWDIVIIVKPRATECNYAEFLQELEQLLVKAEVIHGHTGGKFL